MKLTVLQVDLDVAGSENSLLFTHTVQEEVEQPWLDEDWGSKAIQQKILRDYIESEDDALLKYPLNFQGGYSIVNREKTNRWNTPRGYAIHPGYSPIHNVGVPILSKGCKAQQLADVLRRLLLAPSGC